MGVEGEHAMGRELSQRGGHTQGRRYSLGPQSTPESCLLPWGQCLPPYTVRQQLTQQGEEGSVSTRRMITPYFWSKLGLPSPAAD